MTTLNGAGKLFAPVLQDLRANGSRYFGAAVQLDPITVEERPFSHILRVRVTSRPGAQTYAYVKVFKPADVPGGVVFLRERVAADYATTRRVHDAMAQFPDLAAVRPIACYPEHLAIVTEEAKGVTLGALLARQAAWVPGPERVRELTSTLERVGRWIRVFQSIDDADGSVTVEGLREYIDVRLARMADSRAAGVSPADRERLLRHIDRLGATIAPQALSEVPVHSDMSLGNILVSDGGIVVLDFAMARRGSTLHDLTRVFVQVELLAVKPHIRRAVVRQLQQALVSGFDPLLRSDAPLFRLLVLLHRVNHLARLSLQRAPFPVSVYNRAVCRQHRRWIAADIERPVAGDCT